MQPFLYKNFTYCARYTNEQRIVIQYFNLLNKLFNHQTF